MFQAVYKNGAIVERCLFEMLPKSEEVFFYTKSVGNKSHTEYSIIDACGEAKTLSLNCCKLIGLVLDNYQGYPYIELEFEVANRGIEKLQIWKEEWQCDNPLSIVALIAERVRQCGYDTYLAFRELEQENRQLRWENKELKEELEGLEEHCKYLNDELLKAESQLK